MQKYRRNREKRILEEEINFYLEEQADEIEEFKAFKKRYSPSEDYQDYEDEEYNPNDFLEDIDEYYPSLKKDNSLLEKLFEDESSDDSEFFDDYDPFDF